MIDRLEAGGRRAATCSALKPPQDLPIMPTVPEHQGWAAIQAITSSASSCSCFRYSSLEHAVGIPGAAQVDPDRGIAVAAT